MKTSPPPCRPKLRCLLALLTLAVLAPLARAGTYVASFDGSSGATYQNGYPYAYAGTAGPGTWGTVYGAYGASSCSGAIDVKLSWTPAYAGEPAPSSVVVEEDCVASAGSGGGATANNALGDPYTSGKSGADGSGNPIPHYSLQTPAADGSITFARSPSATGSGYPKVASVAYHVQATPTVISDAGTTLLNHVPNVLIGQHQTTSVSAGPCQVRNVGWGVSNAVVPFGSVDQGSPQASPDFAGSTYIEYHHYTSYQSGVNGGSFYASYPGTETVSAYFDVYSPDGTTQIGSGTASLKVTVRYPDHSLTLVPGTSAISPTYDSVGAVGPGMDFRYSAHTPDASGDSIVGSNGDYGQCAICQLIETGRKGYLNDSVVYNRTLTSFVLDCTYPYTGSGGPADSTSLEDNDNPSASLYSNNYSDYYDKVAVSDAFETSLIYLPPGNDSVWVPLQEDGWHWRTTVTNTGTSNGHPNWTQSGVDLDSGDGPTNYDLAKVTWDAVTLNVYLRDTP